MRCTFLLLRCNRRLEPALERVFAARPHVHARNVERRLRRGVLDLEVGAVLEQQLGDPLFAEGRGGASIFFGKPSTVTVASTLQNPSWRYSFVQRPYSP